MPCEDEEDARRRRRAVGAVGGHDRLPNSVMNITNDENTEWEQWYKVAQCIYNEGGDEELFLTWSAESPSTMNGRRCFSGGV